MSEWKEYKFSDLLIDETISYGIVQPGVHTEVNSVPIVRVGDIKNGRIETDDILKVSSEIETKYNRTRLNGGELLITVVGSIGECAIVPNELKGWNVARAISVARIKEGFNKDFIKYSFLSNDIKHQLYGNTNDTVQPTLNLSSLKEIMLRVPPPPEQHAIASILSSLDDKIDLLHRQNKSLEQLAETLFRQWFVEQADESWEEVKVKDFDAIVTDYVANGSFASLAQNVNYKSEPDYAVLIRLTDYNKNFNGDFVYVDEHAYNFLAKTKLFGGEIIISNVGAYSGIVFKCPKLNIPMTLGPNSIVIKSEFNNYFYLLFRSNYGQFLLDGIISGSAQPKFNKTAFREITLNFPSINYLIDFINIVEPYFNKKDYNQNQIRTLTQLRDTLLPKLMSGEVRVVQ